MAKKAEKEEKEENKIQYGKYDKLQVKPVVDACIVELMRSKVFYGHVLQQIEKVYIEETRKDTLEEGEIPIIGDRSHRQHQLQTFAIGKRASEIVLKLYVNNDFVRHDIFNYNNANMDNKDEAEKKSINYIGGILEHEILHICLSHIPMQFADKERGAIAVDLAVNSFIDKERLPSGCMLPEKFNLAPKLGAMEYYNLLKDNQQYNNMKDSRPKEFEIAIAAHDRWDETIEDNLIKEQIKDILRQARDLCNKNYGNIPGEVIEEIELSFKFKKPEIPWQRQLHLFVATLEDNELTSTFKRKSKRFGTIPGTRKQDKLNLAVAIDTSGSVDSEELKKFMSEINAIYTNGAAVTVIECDAEIGRVYKYNGKFDGKVTGRGGTDLEPPLVFAEGKFDGIVYFTDFYAPHIEKRYKIPSVWVLSNCGFADNPDQYPYKWGRKVIPMKSCHKDE